MKRKNLPYDSVGRVVSKATWLLKVARDPTHREHHNLTPSLKKMLLAYDDIELDQHQQFSQPPTNQQSSQHATVLVNDMQELQPSDGTDSEASECLVKGMRKLHAMVSHDCATMRREIAELRDALTKKNNLFEGRQSGSNSTCPLSISWAQKWEQYQNQHRADQQAMMEMMRKERQEFLTMFQAESDRRHEEFESVMSLVTQIVSKLRDS